MSAVLALLLGGLVAIAAVAGRSGAGITAWLSVYALLAAPTVLAGTALQLVTPPMMRAQIMALHLLLVNLVALGVGPLLVASMADAWFKGPSAIGQALSVVDIAAAAAALILFIGLLRRYDGLRADVV